MNTAGKRLFEKWMRRAIFIPLCWVLAFILVSSCPLPAETATAGNGADRSEMLRLLEEAPSLSSYAGKEALVLSRHLKSRLMADGSMEKSSRWVILYRGKLPANWETWTVPAPEGGQGRISRAELYTVQGVKFIRALDVEQSSEGGGKGSLVRIPEASDQSLLLVETVQRFPRRFDLNDQAWVALDMPQWELEVEVEVPRGAKVHWAASGIGQPEKKQERGTDRYIWSAKNLPAWQGLSVLDSGRTSLGFSLEEGLEPSLETLGELESRPFPVPARLSRLISGKDPEKSGLRLLQSVNDDESRIQSLPASWIRPTADAALGEGPWTDWEATLIAASVLKTLGWTATVWWLPSVPVGETVPAGVSLWACPVIEASPPNGKPFLFKRGAAWGAGRVPSPLIGASLYRLEGGKVLTMRIPEGSSSSNRLSARWELDLDDAGFATGKLVVQLRGGWDYLLRTGADTSREKAAELAREMLANTPFLSGMGTPELTESASGLRIAVPVRGLLGISAQKDLLVRFPATGLSGAREILEERGNSSLRFPFSIQQEFLIRIPSGYRVLEPPALRGKNAGRVTVEETFRSREKKGIVEASQLVGIAVSRLDESGFTALNEALVQALRWGTNSIPLRKR